MNGTDYRDNAGGTNIGNVILGIWVAISPFVLGFAGMQTAKWNNVAVGLAVMLLAFGQGPGRAAGGVLNILLGAWLIASPFVLGFSAPTPFWNNIILGAVILIVALLGAGSGRTTAGPTAPPPTV